MNFLDKYRDERDARGDLTWLALAVDALDNDCGDDPTRVICACEWALIEVVKEREAALEDFAKVRALLARNGCECECLYHHAEHDAGCDRCLACRVADVVGV